MLLTNNCPKVRPQIDQLENRTLLSGNAIVTIIPTHLHEQYGVLGAKQLQTISYANHTDVQVEGTKSNDTITVDSDKLSSLTRNGGEIYILLYRGNDYLKVFGTASVRIEGRADNDTIYSGHGNDFIDGEGRDLISGDVGRDILRGGDQSDTIYGGTGNDIIKGEGGNDFLQGQGGKDFIVGGSGKDTLLGDAGNDTLLGHLDGNEGNLSSAKFSDRLIGGSGTDSAFFDKDNQVDAEKPYLG